MLCQVMDSAAEKQRKHRATFPVIKQCNYSSNVLILVWLIVNLCPHLKFDHCLLDVSIVKKHVHLQRTIFQIRRIVSQLKWNLCLAWANNHQQSQLFRVVIVLKVHGPAGQKHQRGDHQNFHLSTFIAYCQSEFLQSIIRNLSHKHGKSVVVYQVVGVVRLSMVGLPKLEDGHLSINRDFVYPWCAHSHHGMDDHTTAIHATWLCHI